MQLLASSHTVFFLVSSVKEDSCLLGKQIHLFFLLSLASCFVFECISRRLTVCCKCSFTVSADSYIHIHKGRIFQDVLHIKSLLLHVRCAEYKIHISGALLPEAKQCSLREQNPLSSRRVRQFGSAISSFLNRFLSLPF